MNDAPRMQPLAPGSPGEFHPATGGGAGLDLPSGSVATRSRRGADVSAMVTLLLGVPWLVFSLGVLSVLGSLVVPGNAAVAWLTIVGFMASGAVVFVAAVEDVLARVVFRLRRPTLAEQRRLEPVWDSVTAAAGVRGDGFRLWVQDCDAVNAFAAAGHIVSITRSSLALPPNQLAGVLAHELGHHLGGHAWALLLSYWYSLPARLVVRIAYWITFSIAAVAGAIAAAFARTGLAGVLVGLGLRAFRFGWFVFCALVLFAMSPPLVLLMAAPLVLAWCSRRAEKRADAAAAAIGYGQPLLEVLYGWLNAGHDDATRRAALGTRLLASHPSHAERIRALETRMDGRSAA